MWSDWPRWGRGAALNPCLMLLEHGGVFLPLDGNFTCWLSFDRTVFKFAWLKAPAITNISPRWALCCSLMVVSKRPNAVLVLASGGMYTAVIMTTVDSHGIWNRRHLFFIAAWGRAMTWTCYHPVSCILLMFIILLYVHFLYCGSPARSFSSSPDYFSMLSLFQQLHCNH